MIMQSYIQSNKLFKLLTENRLREEKTKPEILYDMRGVTFCFVM